MTPKPLYRILWITLLIIFLNACALTPKQTNDKCIKIGQEWSYDTREGEEDSRITIVDAFINKERQRFYTIRVTGVNSESPDFKNYFPDKTPYFIISEAGLNATLDSLIGESNWNKYYDKNYQQWRRNLSGPDYYGPTVKDKLNAIEEILNIKLGA